MAINCFRYFGFTSFSQVDSLTITQYEIMAEALELRMLDESLHEHRQAFLNYAAQAEKPAGKGKTRPVYRKFQQFFDYEQELRKLMSKKKKKGESRFAGIGKLLNRRGE